MLIYLHESLLKRFEHYSGFPCLKTSRSKNNPLESRFSNESGKGPLLRAHMVFEIPAEERQKTRQKKKDYRVQ
jgi:hypothetical protein